MRRGGAARPRGSTAEAYETRRQSRLSAFIRLREEDMGPEASPSLCVY